MLLFILLLSAPLVFSLSLPHRSIRLPHRTPSASPRMTQPVLLPPRTLGLLASRVLDTIGDAALLAQRVQEAPVDTDECLKAWGERGKPRLLVVGSGWAAHALVKIVDTSRWRVLVVSRRNYFVFTPMLAACSVGTVEFRSITEPMRASNQAAAFVDGSVESLEPLAQEARVSLEDGEELSLPYDVCVYAVGVKPSVTRVEGVEEHCLFLKEVGDARKLRSAVSRAVERASQPGLSEEERRLMLRMVVVGGGPTGVEFTGELSDYLNDALLRLYPQLAPLAQVVLIHGRESLLPGFDEGLQAKALQSLVEQRVEVRLSTRVSRVASPSSLTLARQGEEEDLSCSFIVWAGGTGPHKLTSRLREQLNVSSDSNGRLPVDPWLRVRGSPPGSLFAMGDASLCISEEGEPLPQTAQVAAQQGAYVARLLNLPYDLTVSEGPWSSQAANGELGAMLLTRGATTARPFEFLNLGILAYVGGGEALSQVQLGEKKLLMEAGSTGFLLWRSVYVVKQVSPRTRFLVLFDWLKTRIFGRDVAGF